MQRRLPAELEGVFLRQAAKWIEREQSVEGLVEGAATLCSAYWEVLETLIGQTGARAVFNRAVTMARRKHAPLASLAVPDGCIDIRRLTESLLGQGPDRSRAVLVGLMEELVQVVYGLLGPVLMPVLQEAEEKLEGRDSRSDPSKEGLFESR